MTHRVFAYGTLLDPKRQEILMGRTFPMREARLPGFRLDEPPGCYRMIYEDPAHSIAGKVVEDVSDADLEAFDGWEDEGNLYRRREVTVEQEDGSFARAWAYEGIGKRVARREE